MWYLLAEANGIASSDAIAPGQLLTIPAKVTNFHNSASTFKPYDAGRAIGDVQPGAPVPPPAKSKGKGFCAVLLTFIITMVVAAVLPGIGNVIGRAIGSAIGGSIGTTIGAVLGIGLQAGFVSAASQGINVGLGLQDKFSWKQVGIDAITSGVGAGVGDWAPIKIKGPIGKVVNEIVRGATVNAISQGLSVATGLQDKFDWTAVAAEGIATAVAGIADRTIKGRKGEVVKKPGPNGEPPVETTRSESTFFHVLLTGIPVTVH